MPTANLLFKSILHINYEISFITPAQVFIESLARVSGTNDKENLHLKMAIEEVLAFIIDKFPDDKFTNFIDINFCLFDDQSIVVEMSNFGPPIHLSQIPEFDATNKETIDGLWYKIAKSMVDEIEFINRKKDGWLIRLKKKIENLSFEKTEASIEEQEISRNLTIREAVPEDAAQLVDLAYNTYRYSYGATDYYDVETLSKYIAEGLYYIPVVENDEKIIGSVAIKHSTSNPQKAELGAAMVIPEYRKTTASFRLFKQMEQYHHENPRKLECFESFPVTTHTISQKFLQKIHRGYRPFAVLLNITPGPNFIAIDNRLGARETLLQSYHLCDDLKKDTIYSTEANREIVEELITNSGNSVKVLCKNTDANTKNTETEIKVISSPDQASIYIKSFGEDWFHKLRNEIFLLKQDKSKAVLLQINTDNPLPECFDDKLADLNIIFIGLTLESLNDIQLCYTLISEPVNFDNIHLHAPVANKLLRHIKQCYEKVLFKSFT